MSGEIIVGIKTWELRCGKCGYIKTTVPRWRRRFEPDNSKATCKCGATSLRQTPGPTWGDWCSEWRETLEEFQDLWRDADVYHDDVGMERVMNSVVTI